MNRVLRFLLSDGNVAGSVLALAVTGAYLLGFLSQYWFVLALQGYALGFLVMYRRAPQPCPQGLSTTETLKWLTDHALPQLTGEAQPLLQNILTVVAEVSPRIKQLEGEGLVQAENRAKLKQLVTRYLPDVLQAYLKLPSLYAKSAEVVPGKTAYVLMVEQLRLLAVHVHELREGLYADNVNELLANGQFLREKFEAYSALKL